MQMCKLTIKVVEKNNMAYTVNLYLTTCKLLVNGKNPENLSDRDIGNIHRYINSTTCNDKKLNVNKLNEILKEQLETVLGNTGNNTSQNTANVRHSNDIACFKCKKNCRTRSTFCNKGNHYKCQKLTDTEIQQAEKDTSRSYTCTFCQEFKDEMRTNKIPKTVESDIEANNKNIKNSNPQMMLFSNNSLAITYEMDPIRDEEAQEPSTDIYDKCCACDTDIIDDRLIEICEICNNIAHKICIVEEHESKICLPCKSTLDMLETRTNETNLKTNQKNIEVISIEPNVEETTPKNNSLGPRIEKTIPLITNRDDINHQSNSDKLNQQNNNPKPRLKANKTHFYPADQETLRIKLSELREKEIKLKKTEDQLKVREKVINDEKQKRIQLETRCQNLEARNYELEALVRTMKKG